MTKRIFALFLILCLLAVPALAAETDADQVYCFTPEDFGSAEDPLVGICITGLPESSTGTVWLNSRVVRPGDILTADQVSQLTFSPVRTEQDATAQLSYLPIYDGRVAPSATMTLSIRGKEDKAPVAQDFSIETYKNLPAQSSLKCHDPEGEALTFTVSRQPRRGTVELGNDGSFTYTATDPAGKVSREATVTIQILKPTDDARYLDTAQFEAEWLRHTGIFQGEKLGNSLCFQPEKPVSRGEFITMAMKLFSDSAGAETLNESVPKWLQPYYAAALRSGFMTNFPTEDLDAPITPQEAATLLQNALELPVEATLCEECGQKAPLCKGGCHADSVTGGLLPADEALAVMNQNGLLLDVEETLTRSDIATLLYQVSHLAQ